MTGSLVFPTRLFAPPSLQVRLVGQAITGGASLSGEAQFAEVAGGGRWVADFGEACLWTREKVLAWRRFAAAADGGAAQLLVPLADRRHQPVSNPYVGADTFGLDTWVADASAWTASEVTATTTAIGALGATSLTFNYTAPKPLLGGEHFSIYHANWGWRLYRVSRVVSGGAGSGDATQIAIRPPLREKAGYGTALNFETPRGTFRVDGDISETVDQLRFGKAQARFVEAAGPATATGGGGGGGGGSGGAVEQAQVKINAIGLTLPFTPTTGNFLVAIGFGYSSSPGVNTGWTEITDAQHNPSVLDPGVRAAYQLIGSSPSAAVQPFTGDITSNSLGLAVFEVSGLDAAWTPSYIAADKNYTVTGGHNISSSRSTTVANQLMLAAGFQWLGGGADPGVPTLTMTGGATSIGTDHGTTASGARGASAAGGYETVTSSGTSITSTFEGNSGGGAAICVISVTG